jgi:hypothetical protein
LSFLSDVWSPARKNRRRYDDHLDVLLALVTYMALCAWRSRSPNGLARDLGLDERSITSALENFPGLFRKSANLHDTNAGLQPSYTLHARYARRRSRQTDPVPEVLPGRDNPSSPSDPEPTQGGIGEELDADTLRALLDFVTEQARTERQSQQHIRSQRWLLAGVFVAAVASIVAAVIQALG